MKVSGSEAAAYQAVRVDSFATVNAGPLVEADDENGLVAWLDSTGERRQVTLGQHAIRITPKSHYGR